MDNETLAFHQNDLCGLSRKSNYVSDKEKIFHSTERILGDANIQEIYPIKTEKSVIELIVQDEKDKLVDESKSLFKFASIIQNLEEGKENRDPNTTKTIDRSLALILLRVSCHLDSVECVEALIDGKIGPGLDVNEFNELGTTALHCAADTHAKRCIELLLHKQARTDLRSKDDKSELPIETAFSSKRMTVWSTDQTIEDLLVSLSQMDLSAVKMLAEKTGDIADVAYTSALEGRIVSLAALLMVVPEKVMASNMVIKPFGRFASTEATTIYERLIREALHLGLKGGSVKGVGLISNSERRNLLLCEIELLQLFGVTIPARSFSTDPQSISPLILSSQAGDEQVLELLLKNKIGVNETDGKGNSAVSSFLNSSSDAQNLGILSLLMKHGANVSQKNSFGLIPLHIAAAKGYCQALQILLHKDPSSVDAVSKMQETPLFFAVKNDFIDCVQILLSSGANTQIFNLRKQRPVDLAKSQDMWFFLNQTIGFWSQPIQFKESTGWLNGCQSDCNAEILEPFFDSQMEIVSANVKTGTCKYLESPGGFNGAAECLYEHRDSELVWGKIQHHELKQEMQRAVCPSTDELKRKIFFGGLSPYKDSETWQNFLEYQFGTVENVVVITDQAGDQCSRGFGLIECKNKESVVAEVQRHYVNLWGKKVEIIGAVFKHNLVSDILRSTARDQHFQGIVDSNEVHSAETRDEPMFWAGSLLSDLLRNQPHVKIDLTPKDQSVPTWTTTFRKWFPEFLRDVTKHRKDGKWYPLYALKTDFSANCCLELDHASIGYPKLSDFIGSCPDICRMMMVVAGSGRVTHIILLPANPTPTGQYKFCQLMEEPHAYSDSPSVVENDDIDNGFRCIYDTITATAFGNFSHAGSGEGTLSGSAHNTGSGEGTSNPAPQLPLPGGSDPNFNANPQPRNHGGGEGEDGEGGQRNTNPLLMAIRPDQFTYFTRQPDFFKKYREDYLARNLCFKCGKNNMLWANNPCGCVLWCGDCMQWVNEQKLQNHTCVICDAKVESCVLWNIAYPPLGA